MKCEHCGKEHPDQARFCPETGKMFSDIPASLPAAPQSKQVRCRKCQRDFPSGVNFCPYCGARQQGRGGWILLLGIGAFSGLAVMALGGVLAWRAFADMGGLAGLPAFEPPSLTSPGEDEGEKEAVETTEVPEDSPTPQPSATQTTFPPTISPQPSATRQPTATQATPAGSPTPAPTLPMGPPTLEPEPTSMNPIDGAELLFIPAGEFTMGSNPREDPWFWGAESPAHQVYLDDYWIYATEVTNEMYHLCADQDLCPEPQFVASNTRESYYLEEQYADFPVVYVSWVAASAYCRWSGGRLPSEAEWEKAARGVDGRLFPWGNNPPAPGLATYSSSDTTAVGSWPEGASPYGALDMAGNVMEWVVDYFDPQYYRSSPYENPQGPASGNRHGFRGGYWGHTDSDGGLRTVSRASDDKNYAAYHVGFRCVVDK
jgi:formylglycine-generating enzyme required for sulfatase activity